MNNDYIKNKLLQRDLSIAAQGFEFTEREEAIIDIVADYYIHVIENATKLANRLSLRND